jgi:hypothetical protein
MAGDAESMGEGGVRPALTGRGSLRADTQGVALGCRLPPLRGSISDLAAQWRCLFCHSLRWSIYGRLAWPLSFVSYPLRHRAVSFQTC